MAAQPVDTHKLAQRLESLTFGEPAARAPDFGGPRVYNIEQDVRTYLVAASLRRPIVTVPLPSTVAWPFRASPGTARPAGQLAGLLERFGTDRCVIEVADFFQVVPAGADLYLMKSIMHDWDDERAVTILRHCRNVVPNDGRLLVIEPVLPETVPTEGLLTPYLSDLNMLINVGGRERTSAEFDTLLDSAGFTLTGVDALPPPHTMCVIQANPA